jgi:hypothetical protein
LVEEILVKKKFFCKTISVKKKFLAKNFGEQFAIFGEQFASHPFQNSLKN